jgi:hypothetical protein
MSRCATRRPPAEVRLACSSSIGPYQTTGRIEMLPSLVIDDHEHVCRNQRTSQVVDDERQQSESSQLAAQLAELSSRSSGKNELSSGSRDTTSKEAPRGIRTHRATTSVSLCSRRTRPSAMIDHRASPFVPPPSRSDMLPRLNTRPRVLNRACHRPRTRPFGLHGCPTTRGRGRRRLLFHDSGCPTNALIRPAA